MCHIYEEIWYDVRNFMYLQQEVHVSYSYNICGVVIDYIYIYNIYPILEIGGIKKIRIYTCIIYHT